MCSRHLACWVTGCATRCDCAARDIPGAHLRPARVRLAGRAGQRVQGAAEPPRQEWRRDGRHTRARPAMRQRVRRGPGPDRGRPGRRLARPSSTAGSPTRWPPGCPSRTRWCVATADAGRPAERPDRAAQGVRPRRASSSSPTTRRARAPRLAANPYASLVFPWYPMQRQVMVAGRGRAGRPGRDRGVLRHPAARLPARRLGQPAVAGGAGPGRAGASAYRAAAERFAGDGPVPAPPHWGGLRVAPGDGGVLAGPGRPAARPAALPPRRRGRLGRRAAGAVTGRRGGPAARSAPLGDRHCARCGVPAYRRLWLGNARGDASASSSPRSPCRWRCTR